MWVREGVGLGAAVFIVALVGCGESDRASPPTSELVGGQSGAGGSGATGGAAPNAGAGPVGGAGTGTGGSSVQSDTLLAACTAYTRAQCQRLYDCRMTAEVESCVANVTSCPDYLFSPGSTRTREGTLACAEAWRVFPCGDLSMDKAPSCATPGTRQPGEKCLYDQQCASGYCIARSSSCGVCGSLASPGGACDFSMNICPDGQSCSNGTCVAYPGPRSPTPVAAGEQCDLFGICPSGYSCIVDPVTNLGRCSQPLAAGAPCRPGFSAFDKVCADGFYCSSSNVCAPVPAAGQPCTGTCQDGAYCDNGSCQPRRDVGATCLTPRDLLQSSCRSGLTCFCNDDTCNLGTCRQRYEEGAGCGDSNGQCVPGTSCVNGRCVATDAITKFAAVCGP